MKRGVASVLIILTASILVACGNEADSPTTAAAVGPTQRQATATLSTSGAQGGDNATLKGATALWSNASAPAPLAQPAALKPAANITASPAQRVTPVVHHIVHPSLAARVARRSAELSRPGDMAGARSVEVRPGDKIGMRPGDEIN